MSFTHSMVTIDAVFEATLQVLLSEGPRRLTTTRMAERAGVSVGTIYQYYPNRESLLYAVLQRHLDHVAQAVETACRQQRGQSLDAMIKAFVEAKTARMDESRALYAIAAELNTAELVREASERMRAAAIAMLEGRAPPKMLRALRAQLVMLSDAYLERVAVAA